MAKNLLDKNSIEKFVAGKSFNCYEILGAHKFSTNGDSGVRFTLWAPFAKSIQVVGTFNDWNGENYKMIHIIHGVWSIFIKNAKKWDLYKYKIESHDGKYVYKSDPCGFFSELRPNTASIVSDLDDYDWQDKKWITRRKKTNHFNNPLNIYEVHLGSWKRKPLSECNLLNDKSNIIYDDNYHNYVCNEGYYSYRELVETLIPYVKKMGYTHIELLPLTEHPFDGSWGYQVTGYFSLTSRYGTPNDFKYFVDSCHKEGIGVILDWVPGHFCQDEHGLANFNGHKLFERSIHKEWGTCKFNFSIPEVRSFLFSSASFWLDKYHIDGVRVDGVSSMIYLNYGLTDEDSFTYNRNGGDVDLDAMSFLSELNEGMSTMYPGIISIAEESSAIPLVTYPPHEGGLGFHYKWDMGWMNDTLEYMSKDFPYRPHHHNFLTFSTMYAFNENFILSLSHDEVVHGKKSLIGRMPGDYWRKFANLRLLTLYQMTHSGAKLNFMGNEIAQFIEWKYYEEIEWFLLEYDSHKCYQNFTSILNNLYLKEKALWQVNYKHEGYEWIDADNNEQGVLIYKRRGNSEEDFLIVALNFHPSTYDNYRIGVPRDCRYREIFNSDAVDFGGSGKINKYYISTKLESMHGQQYSINITLPPLGGVILKPVKSRVGRRFKEDLCLETKKNL